jgi:hypothetical protein
MPYIIFIPAHGLGKFISHLGVYHYITKTHLGGQDTLQPTTGAPTDAVGHGGRYIVLQNLWRTIYFCKIMIKNIYKNLE